ncbi:hypothetical protein T439DRAFT_3653 [Meredithblackwellia eburnea MCA 4105]
MAYSLMFTLDSPLLPPPPFFVSRRAEWGLNDARVPRFLSLPSLSLACYLLLWMLLRLLRWLRIVAWCARWVSCRCLSVAAGRAADELVGRCDIGLPCSLFFPF